MTPLVRAAWHGYVEVMKGLLAHGASPEIQAGNRQWLIHMAVRSNKLPVIRYALELGQDANAKDIVCIQPASPAPTPPPREMQPTADETILCSVIY